MHLCCNATSKSTTRKPYPLDFGLPLISSCCLSQGNYHGFLQTRSVWHKNVARKVILLVNLNKALHRYWAGPHYIFSYCSATTGFYLKPGCLFNACSLQKAIFGKPSATATDCSTDVDIPRSLGTRMAGYKILFSVEKFDSRLVRVVFETKRDFDVVTCSRFIEHLKVRGW